MQTENERKKQNSSNNIDVTLTPTPIPVSLRPIVEPLLDDSVELPDFTNIKEKDSFLFGKYRQGENGESEPIEWIVMKKADNCALLLSKKALDYREVFDGHEIQSRSDVPTIRHWDECALRGWLNSSFLSNAFSVSENKIILNTQIHTFKNTRYDVSGGPDTIDKVFILAIDDFYDLTNNGILTQSEINEILSNCLPTEYVLRHAPEWGANSKKRRTDRHVKYWLRTPGQPDYIP